MKLGADVQCHYCGDTATTVDHVRPRCSIPKGVKVPTVPACTDCNCRILGNKPLNTDTERGKYVASVLTARLFKLGAPKWTEEEARREPAGRLRGKILAYINVYAVAKRRAEWAANRWEL